MRYLDSAYDDLVRRARNINYAEMKECLDYIKDKMGSDWFEREKEYAIRCKGNPDLIHRLIYIMGAFDGYLNNCQKTESGFGAHWTILEFFRLASNLETAETIPGYAKVLKKLKTRDHFESADFELQVGVGYLNVGANPTFIEEIPNQKTPDLKVEIKDEIFYCECKAKALKPITSWCSIEKYIENQIKESNSQFVFKGPGVLQIAFPCVEGLPKVNKLINRIAAITESKLKNNKNKNVSRVVVTIPTYVPLNEGGKEGLGYRNARFSCDHPNARYPIRGS